MSWLLREVTLAIDTTHYGSIYKDGSTCYTIRMHHQGKFVGEDDRVYVGGTVNHFDSCDSDYMSLIELNEMTKQLGYNGTRKYFCRVPSVGWKYMRTDVDAVNLVKWVNIDRVVDVYVEHEEGGGIGSSQGCSSNFRREGSFIVIAESDNECEDDENVEGENEEQGNAELTLLSSHDIGGNLDESPVIYDNLFYDSVGIGIGPASAPIHLNPIGDISCENEETEISAGLSMPYDNIDDEILGRILGDDAVMADVGGDPNDVVSDSDVSVDSHELEVEPEGEHDRSRSRRKIKSAPKYPQFSAENDMRDPQFSLGLEFESAEAFKMAVTEASVRDGREVRWKKNDKDRVRACCVTNCEFVLFASRKSKAEHTLQVKTYKPHTCTRSFNVPLAKKKWLIGKYRDRIRSNPKYPVASLKADIMREHVVNVSRATLYRVKRGAVKNLLGSDREQYKILWSYGSELCKSNPGTTCLIKAKPVAGNLAQFQRIYICLGALKKGFLEGCRPFIGLDGCFLKGPTGILLTAIGVDANGQIYPFAYAVVENENYKSWKWFVENIIDDLEIENDHSWTFISDKQKGLQRAIAELMPNAEHRHCLRHLYNNFRLQFKGLLLKNLLFEAGKATRECDFKKAMEKIKAVDKAAHEWLLARLARQWSRAFFNTYCKCDHLLNNLCESFNGIEHIVDARSLPILHMLEKIRVYLMERIQKQRHAMRRHTGQLCPSVQERLEIIKKESAAYIPVWNGGYKFEVTDGQLSRRVVDLQARSYSCRRWDLSGIPCCHAVSACNFLRLSPEDIVDAKLTITAFHKCYDNLLNPLADKDEWPEIGLNELLPPEIKKMPGRPKGNRRKEPAEVEGSKQGSHKLKRVGTRFKCGFCGVQGHTKRGCKKLKESRAQPQPEETETSIGGQPRGSSTVHNMHDEPTGPVTSCNDAPRVMTQNSQCDSSVSMFTSQNSCRPSYGQTPHAPSAQNQPETLHSIRIGSIKVQSTGISPHGTLITTTSQLKNAAVSDSRSTRQK